MKPSFDVFATTHEEAAKSRLSLYQSLAAEADPAMSMSQWLKHQKFLFLDSKADSFSAAKGILTVPLASSYTIQRWSSLPAGVPKFAVEDQQPWSDIDLFRMRSAGADAIIFNSALQEPAAIQLQIEIARDLGMEALLEIHAEDFHSFDNHDPAGFIFRTAGHSALRKSLGRHVSFFLRSRLHLAPETLAALRSGGWKGVLY